MANGKKVVKSKKGCDGIRRLMVKFKNNNSGEFVFSFTKNQHKNSTKLLLKVLPSAYTITAISWLPCLISQLFSHWPF